MENPLKRARLERILDSRHASVRTVGILAVVGYSLGLGLADRLRGDAPDAAYVEDLEDTYGSIQ